MPLTPGTRLGRYEILAALGAGGMGEVYRALDPRLGREVAVKVLPAEVAAHPERLARFEREARAVARLNHPNIVVLHSIEDADGIRFLTMELVEGESLDRHVVPEGLPIAQVVDLGFALADALAAAHAGGVIHRDLKPGNVVVARDGRLKVLDFGLARLTSPDSTGGAEEAATVTALLSASGVIAGTPHYMAPEQVRGEAVDECSDLFALGVILYEVLTGRRPFLGATVADVTSSILRDDPVPVQRLRADVSLELAGIVHRCLEKERARRFRHAVDLRDALASARRSSQSRSAATTPSGARAATATSDPPSIAVLPFENRGGDASDEYFADGITEDVIAQLCKVRTLKVISRASVMPFKGRQQDLRTIAERLQVAHLLEGSVRRQGDRVRIVAQLVDPDSGRNLWAETYDRRLTDIFEIQSEVALQITTALRAELTSTERERIRREPTHDVRAYELYLLGRQQLVRFTVESFHQSIRYFEQAIERDMDFAAAHVGLALAYTELADHGAWSRDQAAPLALTAATRAVDLDPQLGDAHCALAYALALFSFDWSGAEAGFRRALELSPGNSFACDLYGRMCAGLERFDEAIALHERAHELDPLVHRTDLATTLLRAGRNEEATRAAARAVELDPDYARGHATLGWALFRQGHTREGIAEIERACALMPGDNMWLAQLGQAYALAGDGEKARELLRELEDAARVPPASPYHLAYVYTGLGDLERAMDCLELAFLSGAGPVYSIKGSFLLAPLRQHPRFFALLKRMRAT